LPDVNPAHEKTQKRTEKRKIRASQGCLMGLWQQ